MTMKVAQAGFTLGAYAELVVGTTAVQLKLLGVPTLIKNAGSNAIYIGDADVAVTTGYPLLAGEELLVNNSSLYFRAAAGGETLRYIQAK